MEQWKPIKGYEGLYEVSSLGKIKSLSRWKQNHSKLNYVEEKILKPGFNGKYHHVFLSKNGKSKTYLIHKLVAIHFIPNPNNLPQINHIDENKLNNNVNNLEWCTQKYNCNYGKRNDCLRKRIGQYDLQGNFIKEWQGMRVAAKDLNICYSSIYKCCKGQVKRAGNYIWRIYE